MKMVSLLRGINVSGQKKILMADLKRQYEDLGFTQVTSYIQSRNVVFETTDRRGKHLQFSLQDAIADRYGFEVPVVLRSHRELQDTVDNCPFDDIDLEAECTRVAVTFLPRQPVAAGITALTERVLAPEKLVVRGQEIYLQCPDGIGQTQLTKKLIEKKLGVVGTARNWKSVLKLCELSA